VKKQAPKNTGNVNDEITNKSPTWNSGDDINENPPKETTEIINPTDWS
jgi:hypothetical protein